MTRHWLATAVCLLVTGLSGAARAQDTPAGDAARMRAQLTAQQERLDAQERELGELKAMVRQLGQAVDELRATRGTTGAPTAQGVLPGPATDAAAQVPVHAAQPSDEKSDDIGAEEAARPAIDLGPAEIRLGGYLSLTGIYRSTNAGGNVGTSFGSIPYENTADGNVSEARLSGQSSRLSLRVDAPLASPAAGVTKFAGYVEMDFNGSTPDRVAVSSTSVGLRMRHAFVEGSLGNAWQLAAGQAFSLMTPVKGQFSIWPSDYDMSQAVDTNYVAGLVWTRVPQVRVTWRPSRTFNWSLSAENPEQQADHRAVTLPACCEDDLASQYNTGDEELGIPNLMPDIVSRVGFTGERVHADVGGVFRVFRHELPPFDGSDRRVGGGVSVNLNARMTDETRLVLQGSAGSGMGRYIGGLVPDVAVAADGSIHPIQTTSWLAGVEQKVSKKVSLAGYYSGFHAARRALVDADGSPIGFGYAGASNAANRRIGQTTAVFSWNVVTTKNRGSLRWNTQASWLTRTPWSRGDGPASADMFMLLSQFRYNLP